MSIQAVARHTHARWQSVADKAQKKPETRLFIDGKYVDAKKGGRFESINPANGQVIAEVAAGTAEDIDRAVAAASKAFKSGGWSKMAPRARMEVLYRFAAAHRRERRGARRARDPRHGQADRRRRRHRPAGRRRDDPLHGGVHRQGGRRGDEHGVGRRAHGAARALRRRRRDLAVELPAADGDLEDRARARGRQHRGAEARRAGAAELPEARGAVRRGRRTAGRLQRRERARRGCRQGARAAQRRAQDHLHRLDRGRQADPAVRRASRT